MSRQAPGAVAIVVAAGEGQRLQAGVPKAFVTIGASTMLRRSVEALAASEKVHAIVVVAPSSHLAVARAESRVSKKLRAVVAGGKTRADSVRAGLAKTRSSDRVVLVHDAARPFVSAAVIDRVVAGAMSHSAAIPVVAVVDTIKNTGTRASGAEATLTLGATVDRSTLAAAQTPQGFDRALLLRAYAQAKRDRVEVTDEAMAVERLGHVVLGVEGDRANTKITTAQDLETARLRFASTEPVLRVGHGFDSHRLAAGRPLMLGGIRIPHTHGLAGHSDGDALLHAICDALLGASAQGDLGSFFPSSDKRWKGAPSTLFLAEVRQRLAALDVSIQNIDATVVAEKPRLSAHLNAMTASVSKILSVPETLISIKAKSADGMGSIGRGEGIAAHAVVLIKRATPSQSF